MKINEFSYIGQIVEGFQRFKIGVFPYYKCGFLDSTGMVVIPPIYSNVSNFHDGFAAVKTGNWSMGKWGFIDIHGNLTIDCKYDKPGKFSNGLVKVKYNGAWCFINNKGEKVINLENYNGSTSFHNGYAIVWKKINIKNSIRTYYGIIDIHGNEIIPCIKEDIRFYNLLYTIPFNK